MPLGVAMASDLSYTVNIRGAGYLWGSAKAAQNYSFAKPLLLHVYNDVLGEEVALSTTTTAGVTVDYGALEPGQALSIQIQDISGVIATCALQTPLRCVLSST